MEGRVVGSKGHRRFADCRTAQSCVCDVLLKEALTGRLDEDLFSTSSNTPISVSSSIIFELYL